MLPSIASYAMLFTVLYLPIGSCDIIPLVNGYVRLSFNPPNLVTSRGTRLVGYVNISIDEDVLPQEPLVIRSCCLDPGIAKLNHNASSPVKNNSMFALEIVGNTLGRSTIKFYIAPSNSPPPNFSRPNSTQWWWVAYSYDVIVQDDEHTRVIGFYLSAVILGLYAINLVGAGGQMDGDEMIVLLKKPLALSVGVLCRFGILPAVALGIVELIRPEQNTSLGVLSLLCSPAEGASNLLVMLAEGDMTFSGTLTAVNNFASVGMLPLWAILFETRIYTSAGNIKIPFKETFSIFGYIVLSLALGFLIHKKMPSFYHTLWTYLPTFTICTIIASLVVEVYVNNFMFTLLTKEILFACALIAASGYIFGAVIAFISQQSHGRILVMCVETGTRTSFVTGLLLQHSLPQPEADMAKTAPVLCVLLAMFPAFVILLILRIYKRFVGGKDYMEPTIEGSDDERDGDGSLPDKDDPVVVNEKETCM